MSVRLVSAQVPARLLRPRLLRLHRCAAGTTETSQPRKINRGQATQEREAVAARVEARKPHIRRATIIAEMSKDGPTFFTRWLDAEDKLFKDRNKKCDGLFKQWWWATSIDLVYNFGSWRRKRDKWRYIKIFSFMGFLRSDLVRHLIYPDLTVVACTSCSVCLYNVWLASPGWVLALPPEPFAITSMAVGLLVSFRTQSSYNRFDKARSLWAVTIADSRELCGRILARVPTPRSNADTHPGILRKRDQGAKLAQTFAHALKYHVSLTGHNADVRFDRSKSIDADEIWEAKVARFRDELQLIWDFDDEEEMAIVDRLLRKDVQNWPLQVCQEITHLNATAYASPHAGGLGHPNSEGIDQIVRGLQITLAKCERLVQTPIYTPYTIFTGRILYTWVNVLPLMLYPIVGPIGTPVVSMFTAFLLLGIDDIGQSVEQPFHVLPLWQFVEAVDKDCEQLMRNADVLR